MALSEIIVPIWRWPWAWLKTWSWTWTWSSLKSLEKIVWYNQRLNNRVLTELFFTLKDPLGG